MRRLLLLAALSACFGTGPSPTVAPTDGEILFAIQPPNPSGSCEVSPYIGSVAFAGGEGYLATHGFLPSCQNGQQGDPSQRIPSNIIHIPQGDMVSMAGTTTEGGGQRPRVALAGGTVEWVYAEANGSGSPPVELGTLDNPEQSVPGATNVEAALVFDGTTTIIATAAPPPGASDSIAPRFPCCGTQGGNNNPNGQLIALNPSATLGNLPLHCTQVKDCIVASADAVFYWVDIGGTHLQRASRPDFATVTNFAGGLASGEQPGGMAASADLVAWTSTLNFLGDGPNTRPSCKISTLPSNAAELDPEDVILSSQAFSCLDLALDDTHAYFTIVELIGGNGGDNQVIGLGLGRVQLAAPHDVETLDLGFVDRDAGPRQLLLDGDDIITISPFTVGRFKKTVLDGASDF